MTPSTRRAVALAAALLAAVVLGACAGGTGASLEPAPTTGPAASTAPASGTETGACARSGLPTTVAYETIPGVDPNLTSLDVHTTATACGAPVVIWVHGGAYQIGDKANQMTDKVRLAADQGWVLVSVNYRLTRPGDPASARYPDHYDDVAAAVAWVHDHIADYGGDPARLALLGHSAGADIVANVVTDPGYLQREGLSPSVLSCAGPLDTEGFDKTTADAATQGQWATALGNLPDYRTATSATLLLRPGVGTPPLIGVVRGGPARQRIETAFLAAARAAGIPATAIDARGLSHAEVDSRIGAPGDTVMTPPLVAFLTSCFGPTPGP